MSRSKTTSKIQATTKKRAKVILILKPKPFDKESAKAIACALTEWRTPCDEEDFKHLQD